MVPWLPSPIVLACFWDLGIYKAETHEELHSSPKGLFWTLMVLAVSCWMASPQAVAPAALSACLLTNIVGMI